MMKAVLCTIIAIACIGCGESTEQYVGRLKSFSDSVAAETKYTLAIADMRVRTWSNAIFERQKTNYLTGEPSGVYISDFNDALSDFNSSTFYSVLKETRTKGKATIDSLFESIKEHPDEAGSAFGVAKDLYSNYLKAQALAFEPTGSLQTYRTLVQACEQENTELLNKFTIEAP